MKSLTLKSCVTSKGFMMQCYVYRSKRKQKTYLFIPRQDDFSDVPESLVKLFGEAEFSFDFELTATRKLVMADAAEVLRNINENGFFLQLPPGDEMRC
ncbi:MAG: YcgL domain-containing protein [Thiolinea sp.]